MQKDMKKSGTNPRPCSPLLLIREKVHTTNKKHTRVSSSPHIDFFEVAKYLYTTFFGCSVSHYCLPLEKILVRAHVDVKCHLHRNLQHRVVDLTICYTDATGNQYYKILIRSALQESLWHNDSWSHEVRIKLLQGLDLRTLPEV